MFRIGVSSVFPNVDLPKLELSIERRIQRKYDLENQTAKWFF